MDRTTEDKLMSNVSTLKNELDNYYLNGLTPEVTALAARICDLAGGHDDLIRRFNDMERLLESLTPGGSEFAGSPEACAKWVRARLASVGKLALERNRCQGQAEALAEALQVIYDDITAKNFSQTTFGEYRGGALLGDLAMEHAEAALREWKEK
jgi:hypothetical protein